MNSDTSRLIRQETEWRTVHDNFVATFPQYDQNTLIVLSGPRPQALAETTQALAADLSARQDIFSLVYAPTANLFIERNALLYLDLDTLNNTVSKLADAQPFLTAVASHNHLGGVLQLLKDALTTDEPLPTGMIQITDMLELAAEAALDRTAGKISWRDELFRAEHSDQYYQLILVKGRQEFGQDLPNKLLVDELESSIAAFSPPYPNEVTIRLSGQVPLEHGEIVSALNSAKFAGTLALVTLILVLVWGVRSVRIIAATYLSMICGLIWTAAFAMLVVGQYNTISIIFLVMFIGLGVDFAIHLCLKYQEALTRSNKQAALIETGVNLGPAIMLCGVTSALGFLSFVPTNYIGLAEMGIISAGGMVIAVILSLTLIPAFFSVFKTPGPQTDLPVARTMSALVAARPRQTAWATLLLALVLAGISTQAEFDYSTLSLKDPQSEAMTTLRELHAEAIVTDYSLSVVAADAAEAKALKARLAELEVVSGVTLPTDYLPNQQADKLLLLEDASFLLDAVFYASLDDAALTDEALTASLHELIDTIDSARLRHGLAPDMIEALMRLKVTLQQLTSATVAERERFTQLIVPPLQAELNWLQQAFDATEVTVDDFPTAMRDRLIAPDNRILLSITPVEDVVEVEALRRFTETVLTVTPNATGRPVLDLGIGDIVTSAFGQALVIAVSSIFIILLLTLRSLIDAVLVFIPLAMTAGVTLTFSVLAGLPLNMANVVVIPLIFGLGVDNGIHIVKRYHQVGSVEALVHSSTPKAVFLSNLTTLGTFCALSFSTHKGIYSIGVLLTIALVSLMLLTLISLPALLATFSSEGNRGNLT